MNYRKIILTGLIFGIIVFTNYALSKNDIVHAALFSKMDSTGWNNKVFKDQTQYMFIKEGQTHYLQATSNSSASAFYKKIKIDPENTPYLNWSWRIDTSLPELNELEKAGDDYAARVYVVFKTGITPLSARALNYVWASKVTDKRSWPNPFTEKAIMVPLRTNQDPTGSWQYEKVNIKQDILTHFGKLPKHISGIAIMTDADNSMNKAQASYGDIYFSSE